MTPEPPEVLAAGGVVWRRGEGGHVEVLLVHRPRYDDWSFPKGKCDAGETFEATAAREVAEETGLQVTFGPPLPEARYRDHKDRPKLVRYWAMEVAGVQSARVRMRRKKADVRPVSHFRELDDVRADLDVTLTEAITALGLARPPALSVHVARTTRKKG